MVFEWRKTKENYSISLTKVAADKAQELLEYGAKKSGLMNELILKWLESQGWFYDEKNNKMEFRKNK